MVIKTRFRWEGPKVEKEIFNQVRREARGAGRHVRDVMRKEAPRRTGFLRKNIKHAISARRTSRTVSIKVGAAFKAFYAGFIQFGTVTAKAIPFADTRTVTRAAEVAKRMLIGKR